MNLMMTANDRFYFAVCMKTEFWTSSHIFICSKYNLFSLMKYSILFKIIREFCFYAQFYLIRKTSLIPNPKMLNLSPVPYAPVHLHHLHWKNMLAYVKKCMCRNEHHLIPFDSGVKVLAQRPIYHQAMDQMLDQKH